MSGLTVVTSAPAIYRLSIKRFRGIKSLLWRPSKGVNVILGGGDAGKTTILDAIALLLSPVNSTILSDTDYFARKVEEEFVIEAVVSLPPGCGINYQPKPSWPWEWTGTDPAIPSIDDPVRLPGELVYLVRVRGTGDLDLTYEILQPDGTIDNFPVALRRSIGLVRLSGDDRNDRDLRLVQGSALDRLLSDRGLRSRMASQLAKSDVSSELTPEAKAALKGLDEAFKKRTLPDHLDLAITGGQGASIAALIGLIADCAGIQLPLASWGAGTRRLSVLAIAEQNHGETPITVVDEVERGLEPYRQRALLGKLQAGKTQVFVTTHSPAVISAASDASVWYVDRASRIGTLDSTKIERHRAADPEAFLARFTIVAEGVTEVGFVTTLLERTIGPSLEQYGVHVSDGGGHENTLCLLEALAEGGLHFGGFADDEGKHAGRWGELEKAAGPRLFRWRSLCIEANVINALPEDKLESLVTDPIGEKTGKRLRTLAERLEIEDKQFASIKAKAGVNLRELIIQASTGTVPEGKDSERKHYKSHAQDWFKSMSGGQELADKVFSLGLWPSLSPQLLPFCNAIGKALDLAKVEDPTT